MGRFGKVWTDEVAKRVATKAEDEEARARNEAAAARQAEDVRGWIDQQLLPLFEEAREDLKGKTPFIWEVADVLPNNTTSIKAAFSDVITAGNRRQQFSLNIMPSGEVRAYSGLGEAVTLGMIDSDGTIQQVVNHMSTALRAQVLKE